MTLTLDPDDWRALGATGHRMLDETLQHLAGLRERPAWQRPPAAVREALDEPLPLEGQGLEAAYESFVKNVLPYPNGNLHPRFWGWVQGTGNVEGMLADMLASGLNPMLAGFDQAPALVEQQVLRWLAEMLGFSGADGVLCSSGTMANLLGLAVARHGKAGFDVREEGLAGRPPMTVYCSAETHGWARKAVEVLGLGNAALRRVAVDERYRMQTAALERAVRADREAGLNPICVIATAGTVNTGAIDPLEEVAAVCAGEGLWMHVDGAYGALAYIAGSLRPLLTGMERADSLAFDLHKWIGVPFDCACLLTRHPETQRAAFELAPAYMTATDRGVLAGGVPFADMGIDLTRPFRALKVWMSLKAHGVRKYAALIEQNVRQARVFAAAVEAEPLLELLAPVEMNVVCFRYRPPGLDEAALNALNQELLLRLQESGAAVLSSTLLDGRLALRLAHVNHRSRDEDFDVLLQAVLRLGAEVR